MSTLPDNSIVTDPSGGALRLPQDMINSSSSRGKATSSFRVRSATPHLSRADKLDNSSILSTGNAERQHTVSASPHDCLTNNDPFGSALSLPHSEIDSSSSEETLPLRLKFLRLPPIFQT
jgi:hypothetical protein